MVIGSALDAFVSLLPFILLFAFWIFIVRGRQTNSTPQERVVEKLEEIRQELERLRKAVEGRNF